MAPQFTAKSLAALAVALPMVFAGPLSQDAIFKRQFPDPPDGLRPCATEADEKFQPVLDFDKDSCYNVAAIDEDGNLAEGQEPCYVEGQANCRDESDLDTQNVYSRARCNNGWCAHVYDYYFEKDVATPNGCANGRGHKHDWEHIVVFTQGDSVKYVGVSVHGGIDTKPVDDIMMDGTHAKVVYHKDGDSTHAFRFAQDGDDEIENHKGVWLAGPLMGYLGWPDNDLNAKMLAADWGEAHPQLSSKDNKFANAIMRGIGNLGDIITLDAFHDGDS